MLDVEMLELFTRELTLCAVKPGETVVVLTAEDEWKDHAQAFMAAAETLGASTFNLNVRRGSATRSGFKAVTPWWATPLRCKR